jgi:hypothetical protein
VIDVSSCASAKSAVKTQSGARGRGRAVSKGPTSRTRRKGAPKRKRPVKTTSLAKGRRNAVKASTRHTPHRKRATKRRSSRKRSAE